MVFVYIGKRLPRYAKASIVLASRTSGLRVRLIGNSSISKGLDRRIVEFTATEEFYEKEEFRTIADKFSSSPTFRGGFWLKTLERLFVLEQFARSEKRSTLLHAELDQILFRIDMLKTSLDAANFRGIYVPFHNSTVVASVFYCNDMSELRAFIDFAKSRDVIVSEMKLLADWAFTESSRVTPLPTFKDFLDRSRRGRAGEILPSTSSEVEGVVDAAQLGQWVAGIDPRNVPFGEVPKTKFLDVPENMPVNATDLGKVKFEFRESDQVLHCGVEEGNVTQLYNLHLHSKVHRFLLKKDPLFRELFLRSNGDTVWTIPGTLTSQIGEILYASTLRLLGAPRRVVARAKVRLFPPPSPRK